jgi:hypothetical protein
MLLNVPIITWVFAGVLLAVVYILMSLRREGPSEIGLVPETCFIAQADRRQHDRLPGRGGLPG